MSNFLPYYKNLSIPIAAGAMEWVCARSLAGITVSNHALSMDVSLLSMLFVVR